MSTYSILGFDSRKNNTMNIVDRNLPEKRTRNEVSLSAYTLLFSELIQVQHPATAFTLTTSQYNQRKVTHIKELERK